MDLLRLVLARQPVVRLVELPTLMRKQHFLDSWRQLHQIGGQTFGLAQMATIAGDLLPDSQIFAPNNWLLNRAIFLRRPSVFLHFLLINPEDLDFWYAISSGIPEIQAQAIFELSNLDIDRKKTVINSLGDSLAIPWTAALRREILRKCPENIIRLRTLAQLGVPFKPGRPFEDVEYLRQFVLLQLGGRAERGENAAIEAELQKSRMNGPYLHALAESGYLRYSKQLFVPTRFEMATENLIYEELLDLAINHSEEVRALRPSGIPLFLRNSLNILTTRIVENSRRCLEDPRVLNILPPRYIIYYSIMAGYKIPDPSWMPLRSYCGNPGPMIAGQWIAFSQTSIAGCKMFDSTWIPNLVAEGGQLGLGDVFELSQRVTFCRGQAWKVRQYPVRKIKVTATSLKPEYRDRYLTETSTFSKYPTVADVQAYRASGYFNIDWSYAKVEENARTEKVAAILKRLHDGSHE